MKIKKAVEIFRVLLEESRLGDGSMCNQPYFCKAFPKDEERTRRCPFGSCETCDRIIAFDTIAEFVNSHS